MIEEWKDIQGYEGSYKISNLGRVKSFISKRSSGITYKPIERICSPRITVKGYFSVCLCDKGKEREHLVHRLVAKAFLPQVDGKSQVNHKDGNKLNNNVENLEWCTPSENTRHAISLGLRKHYFPPNSKRILAIKNENEQKIYNSINSMCRELNLDHASVRKVIKGIYSHHQGYKFILM